jgi:hypothetical protein
VPPLNEDDTGIGGTQADDEPIFPMLDEVVDDPALQRQGHNFKEEHTDGQQHQEQLVQRARLQNIAVNVARHFAWIDRICRLLSGLALIAGGVANRGGDVHPALGYTMSAFVAPFSGFNANLHLSAQHSCPLRPANTG